jgi:predicted transcriptional regulator
LKSRCRTKIIGLILQAAAGNPLIRSKIMYQTMLNFNQINHYAPFLMQAGLLIYQTLDKRYVITDKGRKFLALFTETNKLLTAVDNDGFTISAQDDLQVKLTTKAADDGDTT